MRVSLTSSSLIIIFIFLLELTTTTFGSQCKATEREDWNYEQRKNGPKMWKKIFPACNGKSQSPINIVSGEAQSSNQDPLTMVGYDIPVTEAEFLNDGHTVQITPKDGQNRYIEIEGTQYNLEEFHFHWNLYSVAGTEHLIDEDGYSMEAQFVHKSGDNKIAMMAVLYESTIFVPKTAFDPIMSSLSEIQYKGQNTTYQGEINLNDFFPTDRTYFSYIGSLTTPPCTEGVNWSVFKTKQPVGETQLTSTIFGQKCKAFEDAPWSFIKGSNGPNTWSKTYPMCGGTRQSPIILFTDDFESPNQDPLRIVGYYSPVTKAEILNDGVKVLVIPKDGQNRYIEIEGTRYHLSELHFHWTENLNQGTVHALDHLFYAMEVHFVHKSDDDKIATVGVLYKATSEPNEIFEPIVSNLPEIKYKDQKITYQGEINLNKFLPRFHDRAYFSYNGSQTTPPCAQVNWSVFQSLQPVGVDQVKQFPKLYAVTKAEAESCRIRTNVRPLQRYYERPVYKFDTMKTVLSK